MKVQFSDNVNNFGRTFQSLPAFEGIFSLEGSKLKWFSEADLKENFATRFNAGQRVFEVLFNEIDTKLYKDEWESEKHNVFEFFKEISGTKRFKKGLKEMLDNDF